MRRPSCRVRGERGLECPPDRGADVVELGSHPCAPHVLIGTFQSRARLLREAGEVLGVTPAPSVGVAGLVEALACVRSERLQHRVSRATVCRAVADHHGLADQARERLDGIPALDALPGRHGFGRGRTEGSREDAESSEDALLGRRTEREGPVDRGAQGLVALDGGTSPTGQEPEAFVETSRDLGRAHGDDSRRRGELDRERDAVEPSAQLPDRGAGRRVEHEGRIHRLRAIDEQSPGVAPDERLEVRRRVGYGKRAQRSHVLAVDREALAAGCQDADLWRFPQHRIDEPRRGIEQVFAVVQHEEQSLAAQELGDEIHDRDARAWLDTQGGGNDLEHGFRFARGRELAEPCPIPEVRQDLGRDLDREASLADAADTGEREQSPLTKRVRNVCDILVASDERADLCGEIARERVQRLQSWEVVVQLRMRKLEDALWPGQITEAMLAQVHQGDVFGQRVAHQLLGRERHHDLPTVGRGHHPSGAIHGGAEVVAVAEFRPNPCALPCERAAGRH